MARRIVITSGKGGVGKTTVTANLGIALANLGARVAMIDVDFGLNNLDVVMGLEKQTTYDMLDVLEGRCRIKQALIPDKTRKNLYVLPSGNVSCSLGITGQQIKLLLEGVSSEFDYVLIDCPAGIDVGFHRAVSSADEAIIVATPSITSLRDADKIITVLKSYKLNSMGVVINRARGDLIMSDKMITPNDISRLLKTEVIGVLPEEDIVFLKNSDMPKNTESFRAYKLLAQNVHKKTGKLYDVTDKYVGFLGSIRRSLKRNI